MKTKKTIPAVLIVVLILCASVPAALAANDIEFTAALTAADTWIAPGGTVEFTVEIVNTGTVDIDRFEFITPDAQLANEYGTIVAGQSASVPVLIIFDNPGEYPVELYVVGYSGGESLTKHTGEVIITVSNDPKPTEAPTAEITATPRRNAGTNAHANSGTFC